jgi:hypothetical protein
MQTARPGRARTNKRSTHISWGFLLPMVPVRKHHQRPPFSHKTSPRQIFLHIFAFSAFSAVNSTFRPLLIRVNSRNSRLSSFRVLRVHLWLKMPFFVSLARPEGPFFAVNPPFPFASGARPEGLPVPKDRISRLNSCFLGFLIKTPPLFPSFASVKNPRSRWVQAPPASC